MSREVVRQVEAFQSRTVDLVSPAELGESPSYPERSRDRLSAGYLVSLAARVVREDDQRRWGGLV